jgi:hypothetical protein
MLIQKLQKDFLVSLGALLVLWTSYVMSRRVVTDACVFGGAAREPQCSRLARRPACVVDLMCYVSSCSHWCVRLWCCVLCVVCCLVCVLCDVCCVLCIVCCVVCALSCVLCVVCCVLRVVCCVLCVVCCGLCVVCLCDVCCVLCVVDSICYDPYAMTCDDFLYVFRKSSHLHETHLEEFWSNVEAALKII